MTIIFKRVSLLIVLVFLLQFEAVKGQETNYIQGSLINAKDRTPVPFASIIIKNTFKGIITNSDGGFKFPFRLQNIQDTLVISSIGYTTKEIALASLSKNEINTIEIAEKIERLDEVVLIGSKKKLEQNAKEIIRLALTKISKNYPFKPFSYIGYYRDYQVKDGTYLNLNEALIEVFDSGFGTLDINETDIKIYKAIKNRNFPTDTIAAAPYDYIDGNKTMVDAVLNRNGANEYSILRLHDAIRNHDQNTFDFINRLDTDLIDNHYFELLPDTFINDVPLYAIKVHNVLGGIRVQGTMFISKKDYEIYKIEYSIYNITKQLKSQSEIRMHSNLSKLKEELLLDITIEYQLHKEMMFPSYISFNNAFEALQPAIFRLISTKINHKKSSIELTFNKKPAPKTALNKSKYIVFKNDKRLKIDSIEINNNLVALYVKNKDLVIEPNILKPPSQLLSIEIKVKKIKDVDGNIFGKRKLVTYRQYREFFVQELNTNPNKPKDDEFMLKNQSIFEGQPIAPLSNPSNYWMNTPLRSQ